MVTSTQLKEIEDIEYIANRLSTHLKEARSFNVKESYINLDISNIQDNLGKVQARVIYLKSKYGIKL